MSTPHTSHPLLAPHPTDPIARLAAHTTNLNQLILDYEDIALSGESLDARHGRLEVIACQAIARVEQLEHLLEESSHVRHLRPVQSRPVQHDRHRDRVREPQADRTARPEHHHRPDAQQGRRVATLEVAASHQPQHRTTTGSGSEVGVTLHMFDCSCGHRGAVFMRSRDVAMRAYLRHITSD